MANKLDTSLTIHAGVKGINELKRLSDEIKSTGTNTKYLDEMTDELQQSWKNLSPEAQTQKVKELGDEFKRLKAISDAKISIGLTDYQKTQNELDKVKQAFKDLKASGVLSKKELKIATEQYENKVKELNQELGKTPFQLKNLTQGVSGLMASLGVGVGLAEIIQLSDEFNNLEARVRLATQSGGDFNAAMASIKEIADSTMMPLTATADLFGKLTTATKELGYSQSEALNLTRTISQVMALSGGSAESMEAAITQLSQGLSAGALRGDEFNSVMEQSPRLQQALTDGLNVNSAKLKEMASEGKLTAEVIGNALKSQSSIIAQEFAQMPQTVSGSLTVLKNSLMGFIGELDNEIQGSGGLSNFILDIANNINNIDPSVIDGLKNSLASVGEVVKVLLDSIAVIPNTLGDVVVAIAGLEASSGQIGLLQGLMDGLALGTGAVADGFKALQIVITGVMAAVETQIARYANAFHSLTGLGGEFAKAMSDSAKQTQDEFDKLAMGFESSLGKAMDSIAKGADGKLQEMASNARQKYEQMATDGKASTTELENSFKDYAHKAIEANNGVVDSTLEQELAQKGLQAVIDDTGKVIISAMETAKKAVDGVDLSKHADSFKALGIDMSEFAGGLSSKANTALSAFNDLAQVAGSNVEQLAMAYNGAKGAIGDNAQGLNELDKALSQAVGDSTSLAQGVKALATEQQNAKNATTDQQKALQALGVEMNAINQGMSQSGQKMVDSLRVGITAIKDTATNATALKTALQTAFDSAINSAKTVGDFKAIETAIKEAGVSAQLSSTQMQALQQGLAGNATASQTQAKAISVATQAQNSQTSATNTNTQATSDNTQAKKENANASEQAANADNELADAQSALANSASGFLNSITQKVNALAQLTGTLDETKQAYDSLWVGRSFIGNDGFFKAIADINTVLDNHKQALTESSEQIAEYSKKLGSAGATTTDVANATAALHHAQNLSLNSFLKLDNAKLDNLKAQIDSAQQRLDGLAKSAEQTANNLEQQLARIKGNDDEARRLEHAQKIADIEEKIAQARARGNAKEIDALVRAKELQAQINSEEDKKARQSTHLTSTTTSHASDTKNTGGVDVSGVAHAWDKRILEAEKRGAQNVLNQLHAEAKRLAR